MSSPLAFLSHTTADKDRFVRPFAEALEAHGVRPWLDERDLFLGDNLVTDVFEGGIGSADAVVVILSRNTIGKAWVEAELTNAYARKLNGDLKSLIPILLDDVAPPVALTATLWERPEVPYDFERVARRVAQSIFRTEPAPVAAAPSYTEIAVRGLVGLEPDDERILVFACEQLLSRPLAHPTVEVEQVAARSRELGMSEKHFAESIGVLEQQGWLTDVQHYAGDRYPSHCRIADTSFERYLRQYDGDYAGKRVRVLSAIVNEGITHSRALVQRLGIHEYIVDHILTTLERDNHVLASHHSDGIDIHAKPSLARVLRLAERLATS